MVVLGTPKPERIEPPQPAKAPAARARIGGGRGGDGRLARCWAAAAGRRSCRW